MADANFLMREKSLDSQKLSKKLNLPSLLCHLMWQRGIQTEDQIRKYLYGGIKDMYDPGLIRNIRIVYDMIMNAISNNKRIWIFGDYDCDGVTATAIMVLGLKQIGANVGYRLPDRLKEGYGMSEKAVNELYEKGCDLIITVDNGIRQIKEVELAKSLGMDVVILDHHEPGKDLPKADVIVDLHIEGETYPFKHLAGCGLAWKVIHYILREQGMEDKAYDLLDIAAIGTVGDVVSLTDENRIIVKEGLKRINNPRYNRRGINALKELFNVDPTRMSSMDIGFKISPSINAPGRLLEGGANISLSLLLETEPVTLVAQNMYDVNEKRKEITIRSMAKAEEIVKDMLDDKILVVFVPDVPEGVVGLVSGKLTEKYHRPSIVFSQGHGCYKASARSIEKFNLIESLNAVSDIFLKYGGHAQAAGMSLPEDMAKVDELRRRLNEYAKDKLSYSDLIPTVYIDDEINMANVDEAFLGILDQLEPCGQGNPKPVFKFIEFLAKEKQVKDVGWTHYTFMGKNQDHVRVYGPDNIEMVAFDLANYYESMNMPTCMNLIGVPSVNYFMGSKRITIEASQIENTFRKTSPVKQRANLLAMMQNAANNL